MILTFAGATVTTNSGVDFFPASSAGSEQLGNIAIENAAIAIFSDVWEVSDATCLTDIVLTPRAVCGLPEPAEHCVSVDQKVRPRL